MASLSTTDTARWRRLALPASLLLNLFLIAMIGGFLLHKPVPGSAASAAAAPIWRALATVQSSLSPQDARAFNTVIARDRPRASAAFLKLLAAREALARQVSAERYDPEATRQALAAWRTSWDGFILDFSDTLVDALAQVSPDGRRQLLQAAAKRGERRLGPAIP